MDAETSSYSTEHACCNAALSLGNKSEEVHLHFRKEQAARDTIASRKLNAETEQDWPTGVTPSKETIHTDQFRPLDVLRQREVKLPRVRYSH